MLLFLRINLENMAFVLYYSHVEILKPYSTCKVLSEQERWAWDFNLTGGDIKAMDVGPKWVPPT